MGFLDRFSNYIIYIESSWRGRRKLKKLKKKPLQTVEIRIKMDCEGCERRVRKSVQHMRGVSQVSVEPKLQRLTVIGHVDPDKVLRRVRYRTGKKADMWPFVPVDIAPHPYAPGVYSKRAPPGYVRNVYDMPEPASSLARASSAELRYTTAFSDDNPNACVVM